MTWGQNVTMLGRVRAIGLVALRSMAGATKTVDFLPFIARAPVPTLARDDDVALDNPRQHRVVDRRTLSSPTVGVRRVAASRASVRAAEDRTHRRPPAGRALEREQARRAQVVAERRRPALEGVHTRGREGCV